MTTNNRFCSPPCPQYDVSGGVNGTPLHCECCGNDLAPDQALTRLAEHHYSAQYGRYVSDGKRWPRWMLSKSCTCQKARGDEACGSCPARALPDDVPEQLALSWPAMLDDEKEA